jgi:tetratricopeptide (TPR) repeat protein
VTTQTTTAERLDEATVIAIRTALAALQSGRIADACQIAEQALANGGDIIALNALLGMLRGRAGDAKGALRHLRVAHQGRPSDTRIATNLAAALVAEEDYAAALDVARADLALSDPTQQLLRLRGFAAQMAGDTPAAIEAYEALIAANPRDWEILNNLGNMRVRAGDMEGGIAALRQSADINPNAAPTRLNLARALRKIGNDEEAEETLRRMAEDFPEDSKPLIDLHDLLKETGREDEEVLEVLVQAIKRAPNDLQICLALGRQQGLMLNFGASEKAFRRALELDPNNSEAFLALATVYDHKDAASLDELVAEAERAGVDQDTLNLVRAFAHRRARSNQVGLDAISKLPEYVEPQLREELLGQFHDRLGNYDEAFAAFTRMNDRQAEEPSQPVERAARLRSQVRDRIQETTAEWAESWKTPPTDPDRPAPVFLLGFPRSGTTLLDTMLMGHPDVEVMEERPPISDVGKSISTMEALAALDPAELRAAQNRYFDEAAKYVPLRQGSILVDKSPLHLNGVQVIHRLFPNAQYILALRHPADSVLSCFISNFRLNPSMSNFLRLDTSAELYDLAFSNWEATRALFPLHVHTVRYEDLVGNTEEELRRISAAIGLSWHDRMLDHQETAANRGVINTASYAQVTEPIYQRSVGRWQHYRRHLEPIMPILQPWIEKFDYTS